MVHRLRFHEGGVAYSCHWVQTVGHREERAAGRQLYSGLGQATAPSNLRALACKLLGFRTRDTPPWNPVSHTCTLSCDSLDAGTPQGLLVGSS